jgi:CBS domain-containing protein
MRVGLKQVPALVEVRRRGVASLFLSGLGLGVLVAYFADPRLGRQRRVRSRDKLTHAARVGRREVIKTERDMVNRAHGLWARIGSLVRREAAPDEIVAERVRAALGRVCSHTSALDVTVREGRLSLGGPILEREHAAVLRTARHVRGVRGVDDHLERHLRRAGVPGLQGGRGDGAQEMTAPESQMALARLCRDLMKANVQTTAEDDTLDRAAEKMALANVGFLPVCDEARRVVGTITDRDIVVRAVADGAIPTARRVAEVMTPGVISCRPSDDLDSAERLMVQNQISRLVITDERGTLCGVISLSDLAEREPTPRAARILRAVAAREAPRA